MINCTSARFSSKRQYSKLTEEEKDLRISIVLDALKYKGVKYCYGGSSPSCFDCSGFVQYIYKKFGIDLPRTVKDMEEKGTWVKKQHLIAGDLVIFHNPRHVGIYASRGKFVHASSSRGIVKDRLESEYYRKRFVGGKNIISNLF
ncbi:C40 family peptidase [candidate division WOR-3 bacterium]|nr:C40 family peptidase [candidate division WOR-3 bacterium]